MNRRIAIVGAPNVGKSTLFNRLCRHRRALVHGQPGMTRDRIAAPVQLESGEAELIDTGGIVPDSSEAVARLTSEQARRAMEGAAVVLLVVDGRLGLTPTDRSLAALLHRQGVDALVVVNKIDTPALVPAASEFHALGLDLLVVSAEHGHGIGDLKERLSQALPDGKETVAAAPEVRLALIGRPNVGKSSLLNRLLSEERVIVNEAPGTTRDTVDTVLRAHGQVFRLLDTAGLRRRRAAAGEAESLAMMKTRAALARADIAVLVMDASAGITTGDLALAGDALGLGRAVLPVLNKWDLMDDREEEARRFRREAKGKLKFVPHAMMLTVSAATGLRVRRILSEARLCQDEFDSERPTSVWNQAFRDCLEHRRPPIVDGKPFRFYYAVQTSTRPPGLDVFVNSNRPLPESYRRYLENRLRRLAGLRRTPLRLSLRTRGGPARRRRGRARA